MVLVLLNHHKRNKNSKSSRGKLLALSDTNKTVCILQYQLIVLKFIRNHLFVFSKKKIIYICRIFILQIHSSFLIFTCFFPKKINKINPPTFFYNGFFLLLEI